MAAVELRCGVLPYLLALFATVLLFLPYIYSYVSHNALFPYSLFRLCRSQLYLGLVVCDRRGCFLSMVG